MQRSNVNRAPLQRALNCDGVPQVALRLILRVERIDLPDRIVIQRQRSAGRFGRALHHLGERFIGVVRTVDDDAGLQPCLCVFRLPGHSKATGGGRLQLRP